MLTNYSKYIIVCLTLVVIGTFYVFSYKEEKEIKTTNVIETKIAEVEVPKEILIESVVTKPKIKYTEKEKSKVIEDKKTTEVVQNIILDELEQNVITKKEETTLYKNKDGLYSITMKSDVKIIDTATGASYIVLNGTLNVAGIQEKFTMSFNEYYEEYLDNIYIKVTNSETKVTAKCDGTFLSGVSSEYTYNIGLDISGELLSCYVVNEKRRTNPINEIKGEIGDTLKKIENPEINALKLPIK